MIYGCWQSELSRALPGSVERGDSALRHTKTRIDCVNCRNGQEAAMPRGRGSKLPGSSIKKVPQLFRPSVPGTGRHPEGRHGHVPPVQARPASDQRSISQKPKAQVPTDRVAKSQMAGCRGEGQILQRRQTGVSGPEGQLRQSPGLTVECQL